MAERPQISTQNGVPAAHLIPTEVDLDALRRLNLGRTLNARNAAQTEAAHSGASKITMEEINAEIVSYREERRA